MGKTSFVRSQGACQPVCPWWGLLGLWERLRNPKETTLPGLLSSLVHPVGSSPTRGIEDSFQNGLPGQYHPATCPQRVIKITSCQLADTWEAHSAGHTRVLNFVCFQLCCQNFILHPGCGLQPCLSLRILAGLWDSFLSELS